MPSGLTRGSRARAGAQKPAPRRGAFALARASENGYSPATLLAPAFISPARTGCAPVAQLDRAPDYESGGQEFESLRARQSFQYVRLAQSNWGKFPGTHSHKI